MRRGGPEGGSLVCLNDNLPGGDFLQLGSKFLVWEADAERAECELSCDFVDHEDFLFRRDFVE